MTTSQAKAMTYGTKVMYHSTQAIVQRVASNGVYVSYERRGEYVTEKVAARYLELI
jgi:hypothetical protein